ncbi:MAG: hypothetical protein NTU98_08305 [Bacteroidetes bacterium]|nr:hypothetical protein [Bacteroidota bacterium]
MKSLLEDAIRRILLERKLFILNLHNGNEKCIQGDLYSELYVNLKYNVALEYPLGNREHADIAFFTDKTYSQIDFIVELKHYSPHQTNPDISVIQGIKKEFIKRFNNGIEKVYVIQILTQVANAASNATLQRFPFARTYTGSVKKMGKVISNNILDLVYKKIKNEIDNEVTYFSVKCQIDPEMEVALHFYICGLFEKTKLVLNGRLDESKLPINSTP